MMEQAIKDFAKQFAFNPKIENKEKLKKYKRFVVAGMGGSGLAGGLVKSLNPALDIEIHRDYCLPGFVDKNSLIIASSYSGNTEEVVDVFAKALKNRIPLAVVATGGKLLKLAKKHKVPYIQMPNTGIQPRSAVGFSFLSVMKLMGQNIEGARKLSKTLKPLKYADQGRELARKLKNKILVIYSSNANQALAYIWKITLNETGKIPAFYNVFPELNHNEMNGFEIKSRDRFAFIFLKDSSDCPLIQRRMKVLEKLYLKKGLNVFTVSLKGKNWFSRAFSNVVLAGWTSLYLANILGLDPDAVPMVEDFKNLIK